MGGLPFIRLWDRAWHVKKQRAATMKQMMSALSAFRTTAYEPCFTYTEVDYFGPLNVKKGRKLVDKRWGAIFTCMNAKSDTNTKSEMNSRREGASKYFSHLRLLMPVGYKKGWYVALASPWKRESDAWRKSSGRKCTGDCPDRRRGNP